jgi:hypothetical protein
MSNHTKGPWVVDKVNHGDVNGPDGRDVAVALYAGMVRIEVTGTEETLSLISREESEANARLIAAAPELLAAIIVLEDDLEDGHWSNTKAELRRLIAKATGEPQA